MRSQQKICIGHYVRKGGKMKVRLDVLLNFDRLDFKCGECNKCPLAIDIYRDKDVVKKYECKIGFSSLTCPLLIYPSNAQ